MPPRSPRRLRAAAPASPPRAAVSASVEDFNRELKGARQGAASPSPKRMLASPDPFHVGASPLPKQPDGFLSGLVSSATDLSGSSGGAPAPRGNVRAPVAISATQSSSSSLERGDAMQRGRTKRLVIGIVAVGLVFVAAAAATAALLAA